jgi:hypothetical protein
MIARPSRHCNEASNFGSVAEPTSCEIPNEVMTMLELRPNCECCNTDLPPDAGDAMICTFECTFCRECVETRLGGRCPNCGGTFAARPIRPASLLGKYPPSAQRTFKPTGCGRTDSSN